METRNLEEKRSEYEAVNFWIQSSNLKAELIQFRQVSLCSFQRGVGLPATVGADVIMLLEKADWASVPATQSACCQPQWKHTEAKKYHLNQSQEIPP